MKEVLQKIEEYCLEDKMGDSFGAYSKYIIQDRAIPDVRDGLKPVQRRILFAMYKNKNTHDKGFVKAALTVGDVIGKYHPHGDTSVYDALVRMSQDWKQRHVTIDFKGNNGSMDGDPPAAYRYTETKLSKLSNELLKDLDKNTVMMAPTFDDSRVEPTVLPSRFPNLLLNGSTGISAGYATNIPPHNLGEIIDATIKRIDNPNCRLDTILEIIKGPDFPTGGIIYGIDGIRSAYTDGRGKIIVRSKYEIVKTKGKEQIIITEIPYEVNKANLVYKINEIKIDRKIEGIAEVRDESDINGLCITIDLKSSADANLVINYLLKNTELQTSYNFNMVAIVNRRPKQLGILAILDAYIEHQKDVITRRTEFDLSAKEKEAHILEGLIKALDILDEIIKTIRASKNKSDAKNNLIKEYQFTEVQAEAIVMLQLYKLTNTDVEEVKERLAKLLKEIEVLKNILASAEILLKVIKHELKSIKKQYEEPRRTEISDEVADIKIDVMETIAKENVIVVVTNEGYVKRVPLKSYASSNSESSTLKPGDFITGLYEVTTLDTLILFTSLGNYLYVPIHTIFEAKWKEIGKHISNLITINPEEKIVASLILDVKRDIMMFTKNGLIKRTKLSDLVVSRYSKPLTVIKLKDNDELVNVSPVYYKSVFVTNNGYYLMFNSDDVNPTGAKASGIKGINLSDDFVVGGFTLSEKCEYINIVTSNKTSKRIKISDLNLFTRAKKGSTLIKKVKTNTYNIISAYPTNTKSEIGIKCDNEITILKNSDINIMDTSSTGSVVSKHLINNSFKVVEPQSYLKSSKKEEIETMTIPDKPKELTINDFIDDFKL